jgi:hypothetical protein
VDTYRIKSDNSNLDTTEYKYKVDFDIRCNLEIKDNYVWTAILSDNLITISTESSYACGYGLTDLLNILKKYNWVTVPIIMALGLFLAFAGQKLFKVTLLITGFFLGYIFVVLFIECH